MFHDSEVIRSVALNGLLYGRGFSFLGRNLSLCMQRYNISERDVFGGSFAGSVFASVRNSYDPSELVSADFLVEVLQLRDGLLVLPSSSGLSFVSNDFTDIIDFICSR